MRPQCTATARSAVMRVSGECAQAGEVVLQQEAVSGGSERCAAGMLVCGEAQHSVACSQVRGALACCARVAAACVGNVQRARVLLREGSNIDSATRMWVHVVW